MLAHSLLTTMSGWPIGGRMQMQLNSTQSQSQAQQQRINGKDQQDISEAADSAASTVTNVASSTVSSTASSQIGLINCPFIQYGCTARVYTEDVQQHCLDFSQNHIELLLCNISLLKAQRNYSNSAMSHAQTRCRQLESHLSEVQQENLNLKAKLEEMESIAEAHIQHQHPHPAAELSARIQLQFGKGLPTNNETIPATVIREEKEDIDQNMIPGLLPKIRPFRSRPATLPVHASIVPDMFEDMEYPKEGVPLRNGFPFTSNPSKLSILPKYQEHEKQKEATTSMNARPNNPTRITTAVTPLNYDPDSPSVILAQADNHYELYKSMDTLEESKLHQAIGLRASSWLCPHTYWEHVKSTLHMITAPAAVKKHRSGDPSYA